MELKEYLMKANEMFSRVEAKLDELEDFLDYDKSEGKLEITFEAGGPKMVLNTQRAIQEIWLAGNAQAWHFKFREAEQDWYANAEQVEFYQCFTDLLNQRLPEKISFD